MDNIGYYQLSEKQPWQIGTQIFDQVWVEQPAPLGHWYYSANLGGNDIRKEGVRYLVEIDMKKLKTLNMCKFVCNLGGNGIEA